jgi:pimeloyl-ACP methyl ester carboxylesterase
MARAPVESQVLVHGVEIALWEWPGEGRPVLFCHAAGFHGRIWDQVIARLPETLHCYAFDARGHGRSSKPPPPYAWRDFGADAAAVVGRLGLSGALGVGHSLGGHAVTLGAALRPSAFAALLLIDPVIRSKDQYVGPWTRAAFVSKRRNRWTSPEEMFESFASRPPFDVWDRAVLRDYCKYGLVPDAENYGTDYMLACPPEIEASIYEASPAVESNIYPEIATITVPVQVVRAGRFRDPANVMGSSPTAPDLAASFAHGTDTCLPEHSHFIPMESPELAAKLITDTLTLL